MKDIVELAPYSAEWPQRFEQLSRSFRSALGDVAIRIDHIGSTAVAGLAAKPIIDIQISVQDFEPLHAYRVPLQQLGYVFRANNTERTKRYFREPPGTRRTHIHVRRAGSWAKQFALLFRDYLRAHADDAQRYDVRKSELAERYRDDRESYSEAKEPFIWEVMGRADRWSQDVGWMPGPSDA